MPPNQPHPNFLRAYLSGQYDQRGGEKVDVVEIPLSRAKFRVKVTETDFDGSHTVTGTAKVGDLCIEVEVPGGMWPSRWDDNDEYLGRCETATVELV